MASNSKNLGELLNTTTTVSPAFVSDQDNTSTGYFDLPNGTTAQRPTPTAGMIRYNSTLGLAEYYDGNGWKSIDSPPVVDSISPSNIADSDSSVDITITGSFFASGATVKAIGTDLSEIAATSVTFNSTTELVVTFDGTSFSDAQEDYDIEVTNPSGLAGKGNDLLAVNASPAWTVAAGTLATIYDGSRSSVSITTGATDDEGATLTYSVSVGSLPSGLTLNTSTGAITGSTSAVGSDTTTTFTLSVTDGTNTTTRQYSIVQKSPVIQSFTSTGSSTFSVPTGVTAVDVLVVAGGGAGGYSTGSMYGGGGGGAGGLIYRPAFPVTPGGSVSYSVGNGGPGTDGPTTTTPVNKGQNSTFGSLTALGGGAGLNTNGPTSGSAAQDGGSGGGSCYVPGAPTGQFTPNSPNGIDVWGPSALPGGQGQQPSQPGDSGTYGFGNSGGGGNGDTGHGSGGGGAGGKGLDFAGNNWPGGQGGHGDGGVGKQYDISGSQVYYAGGGGGGGYSNTGDGGQGGGGSGGTDGSQGGQGQTSATNGTANRGGGGGGAAAQTGPDTTGNGGSGIVIVKY